MRNPAYVILFLFHFLFLENALAQNSLYVAPSGNDANSGTSLSTPFKTIQKAANTAISGTTIYIKAGTYHERIIPYTTGTPANEIVMRPYQNEKVIIDAAGTTGWNIFTFYGQAYIRLENLIFQFNDNTAAAYQSAIGFGKNSHHITIKKCQFNNMRNPSSNGIVFWGDDTTSAGVHHVLIDSCDFGDVSFNMSNGIVLNGNIHDIMISHSRIHNCKSAAIICSGADSVSKKPMYDYVRDVVISNNKIDSNYNLVPGTYQSAVTINSCRNVVVDRNFIAENDMAISITANKLNTVSASHIVRNNYIVHNHQSGLNIGVYNTPIGGLVNKVKVLNNSLFQNASLGNSYEIACFPVDSLVLVNNLIYAGNAANFIYTDWKGSTSSYLVFDYNLFASPLAIPVAMNFVWDNQYCNGLGYYKSVSGQDLNSDFVLPLLVDESITSFNLHLFNTSPAINKGTMLWNADLGNFDYDGQGRINGTSIDVGADENWGDFVVPNVGNNVELNKEAEIMKLGPEGQWVFSQNLMNCQIYNESAQLVLELNNITEGDPLAFNPKGVFIVIASSPTNQVYHQRIIK